MHKNGIRPVKKYKKIHFGETRSTLEDCYLPDVVRWSVVNIGLKYGISAVHKLCWLDFRIFDSSPPAPWLTSPDVISLIFG